MAFNLSFADRATVLQLFNEGVGPLTTDHSRSCMDPGHISYRVALGGNESGARLRMDDQGVKCPRGVPIAVGHLGSNDFFPYGDFSWRVRIAHAPDGSAPPSNAFTCLSLYTNTYAHNEIAWCFSAAEDGHLVHAGSF